MKYFSLLITALLFNLSVQAADRAGVERVFSDYSAAVQVYDTAAIASLMHPDALKKFRISITNALNGNKSALAKRQLLPLFLVSTIEQYSKLSDFEAYKRLNDFIVQAQPQLIALMKGSEFEIVDIVFKSELAYITYTLTMTMQGQLVSKDAVQKLKLHNGTWLLLLPPSGEATIASIVTRFK